MALNSSVNGWRDSADCKNEDLNLFFEGYENGHSEDLEYVDNLCFNCPVRTHCLKMGLATSGTGVHGGVYLSLGQLAKAKNAHKSEEFIEQLRDEIQDLREEL